MKYFCRVKEPAMGIFPLERKTSTNYSLDEFELIDFALDHAVVWATVSPASTAVLSRSTPTTKLCNSRMSARSDLVKPIVKFVPFAMMQDVSEFLDKLIDRPGCSHSATDGS